MLILTRRSFRDGWSEPACSNTDLLNTPSGPLSPPPPPLPQPPAPPPPPPPQTLPTPPRKDKRARENGGKLSHGIVYRVLGDFICFPQCAVFCSMYLLLIRCSAGSFVIDFKVIYLSLIKYLPLWQTSTSYPNAICIFVLLIDTCNQT